MHEHYRDVIFNEPLFESGQNHDGVQFDKCVFEHEVDFSKCHFGGERVAFENCTFEARTSFERSHFAAKVTIFSNCVFKGGLIFNGATFEGETIFEGSRDSKDRHLFSEHVEFKYVTIRKPLEFHFKFVSFEKVELRGTDLRELKFTSVHWPERRTRFAGRKRIILYDQCLLEDKKVDSESREFNLLQTAYRELKQNFDNSRFFGPADGFYFREMEMLRCYPRRFRTRCASWRALYRLVSGYGLFWLNSFTGLAVILLLFPCLMLFTGFDKPEINYNLSLLDSYSHAFTYNLLSTLTPKDSATLFVPTIWTRLIQIPEYLLLATFSTLTVLAIRRRFKR